MIPDDALIGHTGFVGSNLLAARAFGALFNSASIDTIDGRHFNEVVCAGVLAVKWWANRNPDQDRANIEGLIGHLRTIRAERFTLISTIDVYDPPCAVTEADVPVLDGLHPYGAHRAMLERFVASHFPVHCIVRLPALFGPGLKKNALYDLMHGNRVEVINPFSAFQWYPLARLHDDLRRARPLDLVNFATEPVAMETLRARFFAASRIGAEAAPQASYDMRSLHAGAFGGSGGYIMDQAAVLDSIADFLRFGTAA